MTGVEDWFEPTAGHHDAPLRMILLPYAGGGAAAYHDWPGLLPADVATTCVALPARERRYAEPAITRLDTLLPLLCEALTAELDGRPYALFGHSMGALLAYRLTAELERAGEPGPALVAVSGWAPAGFRMPVPRQAGLSDADLAAGVTGLGALPAAAIADPDVLALVIPVLRADLSVCAGYTDDHARLAAPLVGYCGAADPLMTPGAMDSWRDRTDRYLGHRTFPGGHFFVHEQAAAIAAELAALLRRQAGS